MDGWMDGHTPTPDCIADDTSCPAEWRGIVNIISTMSVIKGYHSVDYDGLWPCIGGVLWCAHYCVCTAAGNQFPEVNDVPETVSSMHSIISWFNRLLHSLHSPCPWSLHPEMASVVELMSIGSQHSFWGLSLSATPTRIRWSSHEVRATWGEGAVSCQVGSQGREIDGSGAPVV